MKRGRLGQTIAAALILAAINVYVCRPLFFVEYLRYRYSIEGAYIALCRYAMRHWPDLSWFPLWQDGIPYQNAYQPGLPVMAAALARGLGLSPAGGYHLLISLLYCLAPVVLFLLALSIGRRIWTAFFAGLFLSLLSPAAFLIPTVRHNLGSLWYAQRYYALVFYGEGPNVCGLTVALAALWALHAAVSRPRVLRCALAAVSAGLVVLVSWPASVAFVLGAIAYGISQPRGWKVMAAVACAAYGWIAPWVLPSTILVNQRNSQRIGGDYRYTAAHALYFALLVAAMALARWILFRLKAPRLVAFGVLWTLPLSAISLSAAWTGVALVPQPERFYQAMEIGWSLLLSAVWVRLAESRPKLRYVAFSVLLLAAAFQAARYRRFTDRLTIPLETSGTLETQVARWLDTSLPGQRVFAAGSVAFWMNVWSEQPQVMGCCLPGMPNPVSWIVGYAVPSGEGAGAHDAEYSLLWLRAFGAHAVVVGGEKTRDAFHDWKRPEKFEGVLPKIWSEGDDRIYAIPSKSASLAHVVYERDLVRRTPVNGLDVEPLRPFVRDLEDPALPEAEWTWVNGHEAHIRTRLSPGQVISVQETYTPGWEARIKEKDQPMRADGLGLTVIAPTECVNGCVIDFSYDGGAEGKFARSLRLLTMAVLIFFLWREWKRGKGANKAGI